jgi:clan AA aspartic protease (TIGR02281 family)
MTRLSILCASCLLLGTLAATPAGAGDCDGRFFRSNANGNEYPARQPDSRLAATLKQADDGVAAAQRQLAIHYESGYLLSRCPEKSAYWYRQAAAAGDDVAQQWLLRNASVHELRGSRECAGEACAGSTGSSTSVAVLYSNRSRNDHFFAPLSINGRTVQGLIDTGASTIAMSAETASKLGINADRGQKGNSMTASGTITTTTLIVPRLEVAGISMQNVPVSVGITGETLIGMSFLRRVDVSMGSGTLIMKKRI